MTVDNTLTETHRLAGWTLVNATRESGSDLDATGTVTNSITVKVTGNATVTANFESLMSVNRTSLTFVECENYPGRGQIVTVTPSTAGEQWTATVTGNFYIGAENATSGTSKTYSGTGTAKFKIWPSAQNTGTTNITGSVNIGNKATIPLIQQPPIGGSDDILYLDGTGDDAVLQVGKWRSTAAGGNGDFSDVTKIVHFKFGGVVGSKLISLGGAWAPSNMVFNPTSTSYTTWGSNNVTGSTAPNVPGYLATNGSGTGMGKDALNSLLTSSPDYHTVENLKVGKGDPCQLVGLTVSEIKDFLANGQLPTNSGWRTPTVKETELFAGFVRLTQPGSALTRFARSTTDIQDPMYFRFNYGTSPGSILPNIGWIWNYSAFDYFSSWLKIWTSERDFWNNAEMGACLEIYKDDTGTRYWDDWFYNGMPIRCVRNNN